MELPNKVRIVEVGPRDGLQNENVCLSVETRIKFIEMLIDCGLANIEPGSFVHPKWVPQMMNTDRVLAGLSLDDTINLPVLVPNLVGLEKALAAGVKEIAIFAAASETFSQKNINCSIGESLDKYRSLTKFGFNHGLRIRGYISCVMGCPYEGNIEIDSVIEVAKQFLDMGCHEISLGDTIGIGTALQTEQLLTSLLSKFNKEQLAVHFHDTYGQALSNILVALQMGIESIDAATSGLGGCPYAKGASGNVATEDVIYMLTGLGIDHGVDLKKLVIAGGFICAELGRSTTSKVGLALQ